MATKGMPVNADVSESFAALKNYFTPESRSETGSNLAQLVVFAERVLKVIKCEILNVAMRVAMRCPQAHCNIMYLASFHIEWLQASCWGEHRAFPLSETTYQPVSCKGLSLSCSSYCSR